MERQKTLLKILSVLMMIGAILVIVFSIISLCGGTLFLTAAVNANDTSDDVVTVAGVSMFFIFIGVIVLISGLFTLITSCFGLRAAKGEKKAAKVAKILGIISLVLSLISNISMLTNKVDWSSVLSLIVSLFMQGAFIYLAYRVEHNEEHDLVK